MTSEKFRRRAQIVLERLEWMSEDLDELEGGTGCETLASVNAAGGAVHSAIRLLEVAIAGCEGKEHTP